MALLTDHERKALVDELYTESNSDLVGLWEIAKMVEEVIGPGANAREQSLLVVVSLLKKGLVVGDPPYARDGYKAWDDQTADTVVTRIRAEWISLGHTPDIPDIAWFGRRP